MGRPRSEMSRGGKRQGWGGSLVDAEGVVVVRVVDKRWRNVGETC